MLLKFGVLGERVQPREFVVLGIAADGFAIDGDQARDVSVPGFDDELGSVAVLVDPVQQVLHGAMVLPGVQPMLDGATHEGGGVHGCRGDALS